MYHNELEYRDIQKFKKNLRRHCDYHLGKRVQIFNVHEYGKNGKKHWHLVLFNHNFDDRIPHTKSGEHTLYKSDTLSKLWPHGFSTIGNVSEASAMYQAQYTQKDLKNGNLLNNKRSHSKHSGIGRDYFLKHYKQILSLGYVPYQARKIPIPRYFLKLAHKHYAHFNEPHFFFDNSERKRLYAPFLKNEQNLEISNLFIAFREKRQDYLKDIIKEWDEFIEQNLFTDIVPDFALSGANAEHDLKNRVHLQQF